MKNPITLRQVLFFAQQAALSRPWNSEQGYPMRDLQAALARGVTSVFISRFQKRQRRTNQG